MDSTQAHNLNSASSILAPAPIFKSMLVVIPVCHKDEVLVLKNLDWVRELDGTIDTQCVISYPENFDNTQVVERARDIFSAFTSIAYSEWGGHDAWPMPQNWAWQAIARRMPEFKQPWLWWEADATPVIKGWYDALRCEYEKGRKPLMGYIVEDSALPHHMTGVGIYPHNMGEYSVNAMLCRAAPFDIVMARDTLQTQTHRANHLIQHHVRENGDSTHFPTSASVDEIVNPGVVLFHRCKDGSLIDRLREGRPSLVKKVISTVSSMFDSGSDITVVITNFKRPDKVKEAFESCLAAKVQNVVISASGCGSELKIVHEQFQKQKSNLKIDAISDDRGCNEMWLRGVRLAKTKWVHILHDDDKLLPEFSTLERYLDNGAHFYHWDGLKHAWPTSLLDPNKLFQRTFAGKPQGIYSTDQLWPILLQEGSYSISPISALFPRQHVVDVLDEVEREMTDCRFFYSPKMQVGNDLLLWLRAAENFPNFFYIPRPLISYGHWDGSTTFWDYGCNLKLLEKCYDATRDYFLNGPVFEMLNCPRLVHIQSEFKRQDEGPRIENAQKTWIDQYRRGAWTREGINDNALPRLFADGQRRLPYLLDMVDHAVNIHGKDTIYVLTNTDTIPVRSLTRHLVHTFKTYQCCYSFRRDIPQIEKRDEKTIRTNTAVYPGCDLFAFTAEWWQTARKSFPDMLYATDTWDYCLRHHMDRTGGKRFYYLIFHVSHANELSRNQGSQAHAHNHSLAEPFLKKMGVDAYWKMAVPPNLNPR